MQYIQHTISIMILDCSYSMLVSSERPCAIPELCDPSFPCLISTTTIHDLVDYLKYINIQVYKLKTQ